MDIRQVKDAKPKLAEVAEARFRIIHNLRRIAELEKPAAEWLTANGPSKLFTKEHLFQMKAEGEQVEVIIKETKSSDGLPFMSYPEPVRLFCNEINILHKNQQVLLAMPEDEVSQVYHDLIELAPTGEMLIEQGRSQIRVIVQNKQIHFQTPDAYAK
jgi:hypothetical protein